ncbi:MAG: MmgE/PrpD family protein, partial [Firmicutes bacterium]|nr:MmgE/PrpD family protein [Bacillota bacterium]
MDNNLTDRLIDFALNFRTEDIPQEVLDNQKTVLTDSIGVMSAATTLEPATRPFMEYALESAGPSSVIGTGRKSTPVLAAMANGALIHALDYEDGHDISHAHPNTASIPSILAFAEAEGKSGKEVLAALVIASEIAVRLKSCLTGNDLRDCGWYSPPMFAAYGAVLGIARLLGFSRELALDALSICMTQISLPGQSARSKASVLRGIREALSAKAAAYGAEMARRGVRARMDEPFEGEFGLFMSCFRNMYDPEIIFDGLGERWECAALRFKAWPCCGTSHGVVDALTRLKKAESISPEEVKRVHLYVNKPHIN